MRIGVMAELLRKPLYESLEEASGMGVCGVQLHAASEACDLLSMSQSKLGELNRFCLDRGLAISAVCGDLPGHGFRNTADNPARLEASKRVVDATKEIGCGIVTTHIGVIPSDRESGTYRVMLDALRELGSYAFVNEAVIAIETGPESATVLKGFLDDAGTAGLAVNMDPANIVMVLGECPVEAVKMLRGHIVHTHAKDGVHYSKCDPVRVYDAFAEGGLANLLEETGELFAEVPLGQGAVPWARYLAALHESGFDGFLTIEREVGDNPFRDIKIAADFLTKILGENYGERLGKGLGQMP